VLFRSIGQTLTMSKMTDTNINRVDSLFTEIGDLATQLKQKISSLLGTLEDEFQEIR